jgi:carboxyl-terminal processing protease
MQARHWILGLLTSLLTLAAPLSARAVDPVATSNGPGKTYLVAVGVGEFKDKAINPRPTADADARALHKLLTDSKVLGVSPDRAKLITSANASKDAVVKAVESAVAETGKDDLIILAFFGRGSSVAEKPCFFTPESTFKDRAKTALTTTDLEPAFKKIKGQKLLWMMDVSYKGIDAGKEKALEPTIADYLKLAFDDADRDDNSLPVNRVLVFGNLPFREALTKGDHGLFYSVLADALSGKADEKPYHIGYEPDGLVTIYELAKYLEKEIPNGAREVGKTDREKELVPFVMGQATSRYWVTRNAGVNGKVEERLKNLEALEKAGKLTEEDAKEGAGLLFRMPKLNWTQELRKAYQQLADGKITTDALLATRKTLKAGLALPKEDAETFATKVTAWVSELSGRYIKSVTAGELTAAAIRGLYTRAEESLPADIEDALKGAKEFSRERRLELLAEARKRLGKREDLDGDKAVDLSLTMASASLNDRYTLYTDREGVLKLASQLRGRFPGVGIQIRRDAVRDGLLVATPIKGSPAYRAGIQAGDLITEIRLHVDKFGKPLTPDAQKVFSTKGMKTEDAVNIILGTPNTPVTLMVQREGQNEPKEFKLNRNYVMIETVHGVQRKDNADWQYYIDDKYKIAYMHLTQFIAIDLDEDGKEEFGTYSDMKKTIGELKASGLNGLILDLRENPGGYLSSAVNICDHFVGRQPIVTVKPRVGRERAYVGKTEGDDSFPVVVLINGNSASASEIVAACLQDHGRATIIGDRTYGKGSVQDVVEFRPTGGELKYTIARYYPPSGRNIDKLATEQDPNIKDWGVKPDYGFEVKLAPEELNDWYEYAQDLLVIPPPGKSPAKVNPAKDKQLQKGLDHLRVVVKELGKGPKDGK